MTVITSATAAKVRESPVLLQDAAFGRTTVEVDDVVTCHPRPVMAAPPPRSSPPRV
jgi:hypothetical protein